MTRQNSQLIWNYGSANMGSGVRFPRSKEHYRLCVWGWTGKDFHNQHNDPLMVTLARWILNQLNSGGEFPSFSFIILYKRWIMISILYIKFQAFIELI